MMRNAVMVSIVLMIALSLPVEATETGDVLYSVLFPGWGQIRTGRYGRGALFASLEVISLTGLLMADVQYDRAVEQYDRARGLYLTAQYVGDARAAYDTMNQKWDDAEKLHTYRNALLGAAVGVWALNIVDMLVWGGGGDPPVSLRVNHDGFLVTKAFSF